MARAEGVVRALGSLGKAGQTAALAQCMDAVFAPGDDFMRVALVADIPDQAVFGGVEDGVDGHGHLNDAEPGTKVPSGLGDGLNRGAAEFLGEGMEIDPCRRGF